jgi:transposase
MSPTAVGWDLHRKFSQVSVLEMTDGNIHVQRRQRLAHADRGAMRAWLTQLPSGTPVAMEGAFGWPWVADLLTELALEPHLGHPPALRVLAKHQPKSDRIDADRLGRFWLEHKFPEVYLATPEVRQIRERIRYRMTLVGVRSAIKSRIQAILHRLGILHEFSDLFTQAGRRFLAQLALPAASRAVLDGWLSTLDQVAAQVAEVEAWMRQNLPEDPIVQRLQTIPGIGLVLAHVIRAEVGELQKRFSNRRRFTAYAGLAPLANDSAERYGRRHISPACNHTLRWAFIEAAAAVQRAKDCPPKLRRLHQRLTLGGRVRKQEARVALARELCEIVYVIWKKGEPYREIPESGTPRSRDLPARGPTVRSQETRHPIGR